MMMELSNMCANIYRHEWNHIIIVHIMGPSIISVYYSILMWIDVELKKINYLSNFMSMQIIPHPLQDWEE